MFLLFNFKKLLRIIFIFTIITMLTNMEDNYLTLSYVK